MASTICVRHAKGQSRSGSQKGRLPENGSVTAIARRRPWPYFSQADEVPMLDRRDLLASAAALLAFPATALGAGQSGDAALNTLFDQFMKENLDLSPVTVTSLGLDTGARAYQKSQIDDASLAGIAKNKTITESQFARLKAFDRNSLTQKGKVSYDVIMYGLAAGSNADKRFSYGPGGAGQPYILSQLTGSYSQGPSFLDTQHVIANKADAEAYLARLAAFAVTLDQEIEAARHDVALGVVPPDFALAKTISQMKDLRAPVPEKSSLVDSLVRRTKEKNIAGDWGAQAAKILKEKYYPALDRQIALVAQMQAPAVPDCRCVAASRWPGLLSGLAQELGD